MKFKKSIVFVLALTVAFLMNTVAFAQTNQQDDEFGKGARMQYFIFVGSDLSLDSSDGSIECTGDYVTYEPQKVKLTVSLQKSKDGKTWSSVSGASWSETFNERSAMTYGTSKHLDRLYNYRTKTVAKVLSSSGNTLETVTVYSQTQEYSLIVE